MTQNRTPAFEKDDHHKYLALPPRDIQDGKKLRANTLKTEEEAEPLGELPHVCNLVAHYTSGFDNLEPIFVPTINSHKFEPNMMNSFRMTKSLAYFASNQLPNLT